MSTKRVLLYGSTGYTGRLIARLAGERGIRPILAGRDGAAVAAQAAELGLEHRVFSLDDPAAVASGLDGVAVVLHCAGPFSRTSAPMATACLARGVHYLDITGEIDVFEALAARDEEARRAGVMLLPGVGFDVVPSDCVAAHLKRRLPSASRLLLAIRGTGRLSHGTAATMVENLGRGGRVRRGGELVVVPAAWKSRDVDFGRGPVPCVTIPWGDVATAWHSTGIPDVEVYSAVPGPARAAMVASRHLGWLLGSGPVQRLLERRLRAAPAGPGEDELARGKSLVWGRVEDDAGGAAVSRLRGPNGYLLTAHTALLAVARVLAGDAKPGFQTPSTAYGADFVLEAPGVEREDVTPP